jgi:quercetin dioxygenase-like cupin family protein
MPLIKNIQHAQVATLKDLIDYEDGMIASLTLASTPGAGITLFAFDQDESMATHAAGGDALVEVLEGRVEITVGGVPHTLQQGQAIVMPQGVPHSLRSLTRFKMLLTVVFPQA